MQFNGHVLDKSGLACGRLFDFSPRLLTCPGASNLQQVMTYSELRSTQFPTLRGQEMSSSLSLGRGLA